MQVGRLMARHAIESSASPRTPELPPSPGGCADAHRWASLLAFLERDGTDPARAYESLRERLVKFFAWRAWPNADVLADDTLDRVAKALAGGTEVSAVKPAQFVLGVARNVHLEAVRQEQRLRGALDELTTRASEGTDTSDGRLAALEHCLESLEDDERALVLRYYGFAGIPGRDHRIRLAAEQRLEVNTLRMRVHRLCGRLLDCVKACAHDHE